MYELKDLIDALKKIQLEIGCVDNIRRTPVEKRIYAIVSDSLSNEPPDRRRNNQGTQHH